MAFFRYTKVTRTGPEEITEPGAIVGKEEEEATAKLNQYGFSKVRVERIRTLRRQSTVVLYGEAWETPA
jgi:hypothetical protein